MSRVAGRSNVTSIQLLPNPGACESLSRLPLCVYMYMYIAYLCGEYPDTAGDLLRDGLPGGTSVREGSGWCIGRNVAVQGREPYSFKTCWNHCAEKHPDTIAINGLPEYCFCQELCEKIDCNGLSILTRNNVELGPCTPREPPSYTGKASPQLYPPSFSPLTWHSA
jgi:hypothetical protein